jgi:hypothetical protein
MKAKYFDFTAMLLAVLLLSAFAFQNGGAIKGKVVPAENALHAVAIFGTDTIKTNILAGSFDLSKLKPGIYQVWIEAIAPYQHKLIPDVSVKDNEITNLGEIQLELKK